MTTLRHWLSSGPYTLAMSSGFFGFFAHAGVLSVLEAEGLLPTRAAGSSAGALATGLWAAGVPSAVLVDELTRLERADFWDPGLGAGLLQGRLFRSVIDRLLPVRTFAECRVPVVVSVYDVRSRRTRAIDSGELAPAIQASCTVPFLFHPVRHEGRTLYDGGILDRPGLAGVPRTDRVFYHHLTSRLPRAVRALLGRGVPKRPRLVSFVVDALPLSDPFHLDEGRRAIEVAATATRRALDRPIEAG